MFDTQENRYITRGVNEQVPKEIHVRCFQLIDEKGKRAENPVDYLQIFEFNLTNLTADELLMIAPHFHIKEFFLVSCTFWILRTSGI